MADNKKIKTGPSTPNQGRQGIMRGLTTLSDNFANPNMNYDVTTRLAGAALSGLERTIMQGTLGRAISWKMRGDKQAFKRVIGGQILQATVGRMGSVGQALAASIAKANDMVDDNPAIEEINRIKRKTRGGAEVSNDDLFAGLEKTAKNIDERFGYIVGGFEEIADTAERMDQRLKKVEDVNKENLKMLADEMFKKLEQTSKPIVDKLINTEKAILDITTGLQQHDKQIKSINSTIRVLAKRMTQEGGSKTQGSGIDLSGLPPTERKIIANFLKTAVMGRGAVGRTGMLATGARYGAGAAMGVGAVSAVAKGGGIAAALAALPAAIATIMNIPSDYFGGEGSAADKLYKYSQDLAKKKKPIQDIYKHSQTPMPKGNRTRREDMRRKGMSKKQIEDIAGPGVGKGKNAPNWASENLPDWMLGPHAAPKKNAPPQKPRSQLEKEVERDLSAPLGSRNIKGGPIERLQNRNRSTEIITMPDGSKRVLDPKNPADKKIIDKGKSDLRKMMKGASLSGSSGTGSLMGSGREDQLQNYSNKTIPYKEVPGMSSAIAGQIHGRRSADPRVKAPVRTGRVHDSTVFGKGLPLAIEGGPYMERGRFGYGTLQGRGRAGGHSEYSGGGDYYNNMGYNSPTGLEGLGPPRPQSSVSGSSGSDSLSGGSGMDRIQTSPVSGSSSSSSSLSGSSGSSLSGSSSSSLSGSSGSDSLIGGSRKDNLSNNRGVMSLDRLKKVKVEEGAQYRLRGISKKHGQASVRYKNPGAQWPGRESHKFGASGFGWLRPKGMKPQQIARFEDPVLGMSNNIRLFQRRYATGKKTLKEGLFEWRGGYGAWNSLPPHLKKYENVKITPEMGRDPAFMVPLMQAFQKHEAGRKNVLSAGAMKQALDMSTAGGVKPYLAGIEKGTYTIPGQTPKAQGLGAGWAGLKGSGGTQSGISGAEGTNRLEGATSPPQTKGLMGAGQGLMGAGKGLLPPQPGLEPLRKGDAKQQWGFRGNGSTRGVDKRLMDLFESTAKDFPLRVRFMSGKKGRTSGSHSYGKAGDIVIYDENGNALPAYQNPETYRIYEMYGQLMRRKAQDKYPELADSRFGNEEIEWGGQFGTTGYQSGKGKMKYGSLDSMDFRIQRRDVTTAGSIQGGLTKNYKGKYDKGDMFGGSKPFESDKQLAADMKELEDFRLTPKEYKELLKNRHGAKLGGERGLFGVTKSAGRLDKRVRETSTASMPKTGVAKEKGMLGGFSAAAQAASGTGTTLSDKAGISKVKPSDKAGIPKESRLSGLASAAAKSQAASGTGATIKGSDAASTLTGSTHGPTAAAAGAKTVKSSTMPSLPEQNPISTDKAGAKPKPAPVAKPKSVPAPVAAKKPAATPTKPAGGTLGITDKKRLDANAAAKKSAEASAVSSRLGVSKKRLDANKLKRDEVSSSRLGLPASKLAKNPGLPKKDQKDGSMGSEENTTGGGSNNPGESGERYSGGKEMPTPTGYNPESEEASPGNNGYGTYMNCFI